MTEREPFRGGHVRRRHPCYYCETPTRRRRRGFFVCSRCRIPTAEERLLAIVAGASTAGQLGRLVRRED
jgi:ribosomal protein L37AE/L43A